MNMLKTRSLVLFVVVLAAGFLGGRACSTGGKASPSGAEANAAPVMWTCSMHPQVRLPEQTPCPICFMDLVPATSADDEDLGPRSCG